MITAKLTQQPNNIPNNEASKMFKKKKQKHKRSYCIDYDHWEDITCKRTRLIYKNMQTGHLTKHAIAELVEASKYTNTFEDAILLAFKLTPKTLTPEETEQAIIAFQIGQTENMARLQFKATNGDEKIYNNLKVIAELRNKMPKTNDNQANQTTIPQLNINLTKHRHPDETNNTKKKKLKPLTLPETNTTN